ncbi:MAG: NAD-dependent epimerase/dehydratase family protein [Chloroflexi bacterium]|nr:NAD-dependent epimerase/dehydratase family protein [Chloroflexota bacterium]
MPNADAPILITGANGFIGQHVCRYFAAQGHTVRAAVRTADRAVAATESVMVGDIGPQTQWEPALAGTRAVVHLAGRAHVINETTDDDPLSLFREVNVEGTRTLAQAAAAVGVERFVFVSSIGVNGDSGTFTEASPPAPHADYAVSKWEAEQALTEIADATGLAVTVVRPPLVYGPGAPGNFARLLRWVARGVPLPLANTNNRRSFVGVVNLADFLLRCVDHPAAMGELFLISDAEAISTTDLIRQMAAALDRSARLFPFPEPLLRAAGRIANRERLIDQLFGTLVVDAQKARDQLGWSPPQSLSAGLADVAQWYREYHA